MLFPSFVSIKILIKLTNSVEEQHQCLSIIEGYYLFFVSCVFLSNFQSGTFISIRLIFIAPILDVYCAVNFLISKFILFDPSRHFFKSRTGTLTLMIIITGTLTLSDG